MVDLGKETRWNVFVYQIEARNLQRLFPQRLYIIVYNFTFDMMKQKTVQMQRRYSFTRTIWILNIICRTQKGKRAEFDAPAFSFLHLQTYSIRRMFPILSQRFWGPGSDFAQCDFASSCLLQTCPVCILILSCTFFFSNNWQFWRYTCHSFIVIFPWKINR